MDEWTDERTDEETDKWTDEKTDEKTDEWTFRPRRMGSGIGFMGLALGHTMNPQRCYK